VIYARNPASFVGEGTSRKRANTELPAQSETLDRLFIPVERLRQHHEAFVELERVAFAVEVHFGDDVARQVTDAEVAQIDVRELLRKAAVLTGGPRELLH
jgi:hypothetical protein